MALVGIQDKKVPEVFVASIKVSILSNMTIRQYLNNAFDDLYNYLSINHLSTETFKGLLCQTNSSKLEYQAIEAVLFLRAPIQGTDKIQIYKLLETHVISCVHIGDFRTIGKTHEEIVQWIKENNYRITDAYRELYYKHDLRYIQDTITEIQYPVSKVK